jgi:hypothetical protein
MAQSPPVHDIEPAARMRSWLDRPLSNWWCVVGWLASTAVFVAIVQFLGGASPYDADEANISTWPIAHGQLSCAFPKGRILIAPLYPYVSGGLSAIARIGHSVPFPTRSAFGPDCAGAYDAVTTWASRAGALTETLLIGYVGWLALLAGVVALLRASGRGRRGWEPATLLLLACLPPVWMCLENFFHPQDLLAMGLALGALACARRGSWIGAGVLVALATLSQQFALLVAAPLFVVAPASRRWSYVGAAAGTTVLALAALFATSSSLALGAALLGSGNSGGSGTVVSSVLRLHGGVLVFVSRMVPLELALVLAWWVTRRLGPAALEPVPLISLVALSLSLRLVFEHALYGYYFMALAVVLVVLDAVSGHIRASLVAWLAAVSVVYLVGPTTSSSVWPATSWAADAQRSVAPVVLGLALAGIVLGAARGGLGRQQLVWLALAIGAALAWPSTYNPLSAHVSSVWWQMALVLSGIALAAGPLLERTERQVPFARTLSGSSGAMA